MLLDTRAAPALLLMRFLVIHILTLVVVISYHSVIVLYSDAALFIAASGKERFVQDKLMPCCDKSEHHRNEQLQRQPDVCPQRPFLFIIYSHFAHFFFPDCLIL